MQITKRALVLLVAGAVSAGASRTLAYIQGQQQPSQQELSRQQPAQSLVAKGELASVDINAKTLTIRPTGQSPARFRYTDKTKVTGAENDVAGLATMTGVQVTIHYTGKDPNFEATEIEVQPKAK